jgi:hypothetical protein
MFQHATFAVHNSCLDCTQHTPSLYASEMLKCVIIDILDEEGTGRLFLFCHISILNLYNESRVPSPLDVEHRC